MANSFGTSSPDSIVIMEALNTWGVFAPAVENISRNFSAQGLMKGQAVHTRLISTPVVNNFGTAATDANDTDKAVTLTNHKQIMLSFTSAEMSSTNRQLLLERIPAVQQAFAYYFASALSGLWTIANYTNATTVASGWTKTNTLDVMKTALNKRKVSNFNRFFVGNSDVFGALTTDTNLFNAQINQGNTSTFTAANLPPVVGFNSLMEYPDLPTTGTMVGFAGGPDSAMLVTAVPRDPREIMPDAPMAASFEVITSPISGLSVVVGKWIDAQYGANYRICWLDGEAVGNPASGQLLKTT